MRVTSYAKRVCNTGQDGKTLGFLEKVLKFLKVFQGILRESYWWGSSKAN